MKKYKFASLIIASAILFLCSGYLLYVNAFFDNLKSQTFNEITTPFVTIIAALIYLFTLFEIRKQSKNANSNFQFAFFKEKIEKEKIRLEKWKFNLTTIGYLEKYSELIADSNGLNYGNLYHAIYMEIIESEEYLSDLQNGVFISHFDEKKYVRLIYALFSIHFQVHSNNNNIERMLKEINNSELSNFHKKSLNEFIILELLNDYMMIFYYYHDSLKHTIQVQGKSIGFSFHEIIYKTHYLLEHSIVDKDLKLQSSLKDNEFDRLSNYIYKNNLHK